jgi:predicted Holliday junction resolvase-like endonuclease
MTMPTIIVCVIVILLALLCIPLIKSSLAKKRKKVVEKQLKESRHVTEKEKIKEYGESINEETRNRDK